MDSVWEIIKGAGSMVGLATGLFVVWDRFFRNAPTAIIVMRPLSPNSKTSVPFLRVSNPSERPILLSWENGSPIGRLGIMTGHEVRDIVVALVGGRTTIVLDSEEVRELPLARPVDRQGIDPENYVDCELWWRFAQPKIWKRDRRLSATLPMKSLRALDPDGFEAPD